MFAGVLARNLVRGQTNFMRGIMNYGKIYNAEKMLADHERPVHYELPMQPRSVTDGRAVKAPQLYIHARPEAEPAATSTFHRALRRDDAHGRFHLTIKSAPLLFPQLSNLNGRMKFRKARGASHSRLPRRDVRARCYGDLRVAFALSAASPGPSTSPRRAGALITAGCQAIGCEARRRRVRKQWGYR
jgi:hypothetical protein